MAGSGLTGFLQNIGTGEMLVIAIVALVVLGPERLPEMARSAGRMMTKLKSMSSDLQSQMGDVMSDPSMQPIKELGELATRPRQKLGEYMLEAEAEQRAKAGTDAALAHPTEPESPEPESPEPESAEHESPEPESPAPETPQLDSVQSDRADLDPVPTDPADTADDETTT